jgi:hypothetical protein
MPTLMDRQRRTRGAVRRPCRRTATADSWSGSGEAGPGPARTFGATSPPRRHVCTLADAIRSRARTRGKRSKSTTPPRGSPPIAALPFVPFPSWRSSPTHPWTNDRIERIFRTFKETVSSRFWLVASLRQLDRFCADQGPRLSGYRHGRCISCFTEPSDGLRATRGHCTPPPAPARQRQSWLCASSSRIFARMAVGVAGFGMKFTPSSITPFLLMMSAV